MSKIYFPLPRKQIASLMLANFNARHREETCFKQFVSSNATKHLQETTSFFYVLVFVN